MQSNKPKNDEDEILEGVDFDLEDFDDEDDLGDESWDENDTAQESTGTGNTERVQSPRGSSGNRTFVQKNFNAIVIGVVAVIGGLVFVSQMGSSPSSGVAVPESALPGQNVDTGQFDINEPTAPQEIDELSSNADLPPMPAPMNTPSEEDLAAAPSDIEQEVLTPMPETSDSLEPVAGVTELTIEENVPSEEIPPVQENLPQDIAPVSDFAQEIPAELPAFETEETAPLPAAEIAALSESVSALETRFSNDNNKISEDISRTNQKIDDLVRSLSTLEEKLENLTAAQAELASGLAAIPAQNAAPAISETPKSPAPEPASLTPRASVQPASQKPAAWVLRSAQPGKAVVSSSGSEDLRTVEVGDSLTGLGRIYAISQEGGKWVVRAQKGEISQ